MPYIIIEDFRAGLDRRKLAVSSPQGSLQTLSNAHITRGGEIEKRLAMVARFSLPSGQTYGLAGANGVLYTFGSDASPAVPAGVTYQRLEHPDGEGMNGLIAAEFFDGKIFAVASYANGDVLQFYDGARVTDWDSDSEQTVAGQKAVTALTLKDKVYAPFASVLAFSAIDDASDWGGGEGTGAGFKNMANQSAGSEALTALGRYQDLMAVFARRNTQIWYFDPDPVQNAQRQVLSNIGTFAARSVQSFGEIDVFFLSDSGIRSLRARYASNQAGVSDVGTPIDDEVVAYLDGLTDDQKARACAVIEPRDGRYILSVGDRTYVFSYYESSKISAWSRYDLGFQVSDYVSMDGRLWARSGDTIYLLGGDDRQQYDNSAVEVDMPYVDGRAIATFKSFKGFDIVCEGEWTVYVNTDPNKPEAESKIAIVNTTSIPYEAIGMVGQSPVVKLRLVCDAPGGAKLSKVIVHYDAAQAN